MPKVRWGILSTAHIAVDHVIPALQRSASGEAWAIASRDFKKAQECAQRLGIPKIYGDYQEMLQDPEIQAVYVPLPNSLHAQWAIRALQSGKHVLCEKPIASNAQEARQMAACARKHGRLLWEAFMWRFHPRTAQLMDLLSQGTIGEIKFIRGGFSFYLGNPQSTRWSSELAGGALLDVGVYPVNFARLVTGEEPLRVMAVMDLASGTENASHPVDMATTAIVEFPRRVHLSFSCRFDTGFEGQWMEIVGRHGRIEIDWPFNPKENLHGILLTTEEIQIPRYIPAPQVNQFQLEVEAMNCAILSTGPSAPPFTKEDDFISQMIVVDALRLSGISGQPVNLKE